MTDRERSLPVARHRLEPNRAGLHGGGSGTRLGPYRHRREGIRQWEQLFRNYKRHGLEHSLVTEGWKKVSRELLHDPRTHARLDGTEAIAMDM